MLKYRCRFHDSETGKEILAESPEAAAEELVRQKDATLSMPCATTILNPWRVYVSLPGCVEVLYRVRATLTYKGVRA
jgi:hypothetical protein